MKFTVRSGVIHFHDDKGGNHASMFGPKGEKLHPRGDLNAFSDEHKTYAWAYDLSAALADGQRFVFATADREIVGEVRGGGVKIASPTYASVGRVAGVPLGVTYLVEETISPPTPVAGPRPSSALAAVSSRMPKVSIVTCSYNRPDLLRAAIKSLRAQTDASWEHLIYDDASTDPAVEEVLLWAQRDARVRVWRRDENLDRPSVLWNFMLDRANGKYLTVLDDDNEKLPRFVEVMSGELDADPDLDFVTCGWLVIRPDGEKEADYHLNLSTCVPELNRLSTCDGGAMLYRREVFEKVGYFSEKLRTNEDWDWMRRAVNMSKWKNLHECYSTYRSHDGNRMLRSDDLGNKEDILTLKAREIKSTFGVRVVRPPSSRFTRSQEDATSSIERAISSLTWVEHGDDLGVVISPFQQTDAEISKATLGCTKILSIHMEDPYALSANMDRVRAMAATRKDVWVATNEAGCAEHYRSVVGDRIIVWPSLGADTSLAVPEATRDIDVLLCGYAYPSRKRFMNELLPLLTGKRVALVGDGWDGYPADIVMGTQDLTPTYALHARAKTVICLHRVHGDCSDSSVEPSTVNRGFMEGFSGARVFMDRSRDNHSIDVGDVIWFNDAEDLAHGLDKYLKTLAGRSSAERFAARCKTIFSYQTRIARILNCVRAPRTMVVIP